MITLGEALEILNDDTFVNELDDHCKTVDLIVLPSDSDSLKNEDEEPGNATGIANVKDVPGPAEVHFTTSHNADLTEMCVCVFQCQPTALLRASGSTQGG